MTVGQLRRLLETIPDDYFVTIDRKGFTFQVHHGNNELELKIPDPIPPARCEVCNKVNDRKTLFVTEYACCMEHYNLLTKERKDAAIAKWTKLYRERGYYVP